MIKCNVTINGIVSRTASMCTNKEGKSYIGFAVKTTIPAKAGGCKQRECRLSASVKKTCISISMPRAWIFSRKTSVMRLKALSSSGVRWANRWRKRETRGAIPTGYSLPSARRSTRKTFPLHGCASSVLPLKKMVGSTLKHVSVPKECWNSPYIWTKSTSPAGWRK